MENFVRREVIRSQLEHLACRLAENGEECFVVTATNPNILGSDKGIAYCRILFQGIQRAFSRHVEAHQTADRDQAIEQGLETSTEDEQYVHSKLRTHLKIENPIRHESENDHCGNNYNDKGEPYPTPRKVETLASSRNKSTSQWNDRGKQPSKDNNTSKNMYKQSMSSSADSDSELLGIGTDEDSTNADSLLSESELLAESSKQETTGLKRTNQMDEDNSDMKRFKPATPSSRETISESLPELNNGINLNTVGPSTSGVQSTRQKSFKNRSSVNHHRKREHQDTEYKPQKILRMPLEELEKELKRNNDVSTSYNPDESSNENMPK
ncbi:hypothetical protein MAR_014715 [Mya arenaria]|uniref:Uncharacterized protein n=1 Tax=Mya arenaria TaxID=6604 RepID=A0ABY7FNF1_MYAAR|nr:hypothetical protein MAR_014715 [Mya arenaria]